MAKRYFTVDEVNHLVAELETIFARVMLLRGQLKTIHKRLEAVGFAPTGEHFTPEVPGAPPETVRDRAAFKALTELLRADLAAISDLGCQIKDVEIGLVDWLALDPRTDGEVLLCWRFGEKEVAWYHDLEAGFAGRRPVSELSSPPPPKPRTLH
jgi:hypothetical protein